MVLLNFYAKKWKEMGDEAKEVAISIPHTTGLSPEKTVSCILELTDAVGGIRVMGSGNGEG